MAFSCPLSLLVFIDPFGQPWRDHDPHSNTDGHSRSHNGSLGRDSHHPPPVERGRKSRQKTCQNWYCQVAYGLLVKFSSTSTEHLLRLCSSLNLIGLTHNSFQQGVSPSSVTICHHSASPISQPWGIVRLDPRAGVGCPPLTPRLPIPCSRGALPIRVSGSPLSNVVGSSRFLGILLAGRMYPGVPCLGCLGRVVKIGVLTSLPPPTHRGTLGVETIWLSRCTRE